MTNNLTNRKKVLALIQKKGTFALPQTKQICKVCKDGAVAQSVEQKTENLCVGGSIPSYTTNQKYQPL